MRELSNLSKLTVVLQLLSLVAIINSNTLSLSDIKDLKLNDVDDIKSQLITLFSKFIDLQASYQALLIENKQIIAENKSIQNKLKEVENNYIKKEAFTKINEEIKELKMLLKENSPKDISNKLIALTEKTNDIEKSFIYSKLEIKTVKLDVEMQKYKENVDQLERQINTCVRTKSFDYLISSFLKSKLVKVDQKLSNGFKYSSSFYNFEEGKVHILPTSS